MAQKQQPKIEIEDLQPKDTLAGYRATWQEGGLIASAYLEPLNDQPARGFKESNGYKEKGMGAPPRTPRKISLPARGWCHCAPLPW